PFDQTEKENHLPVDRDSERFPSRLPALGFEGAEELEAPVWNHRDSRGIDVEKSEQLPLVGLGVNDDSRDRAIEALELGPVFRREPQMRLDVVRRVDRRNAEPAKPADESAIVGAVRGPLEVDDVRRKDQQAAEDPNVKPAEPKATQGGRIAHAGSAPR